MTGQIQAKSEQMPFFVYGTLLPNQPNFSLWPTQITLAAPVYLPSAVLFDMGSYPMLIERPGGRVRGALITVADAQYAATMRALDELEMYRPEDPERSFYLRAPREVVLTDGSTQRAWVYIGKTQWVIGREPFGGDWLAYASAGRARIEAWWTWYRQTADASLLDNERETT